MFRAAAFMKDKAGADSCARLVKFTGYAGGGKL